MRKDILPYYRALGLNPGAGPVEIRRAWRQMVQQWHPDLYKPGSLMQKTAEDITKEANEAYGQLYRKKLYRQYPPREERVEEPAAAPSKPVEAEPMPPREPRKKSAVPRPVRRAKAARPDRPVSSGGGYSQWEDRVLNLLRGRRARVALMTIFALAAIPLCWAIWKSIPAFSVPALREPVPPPGAAVATSGLAPPPAPVSRERAAAAVAEVASDRSPVAREWEAPFRGFTMETGAHALALSTAALIEPPAPVPATPDDPLWQSAALISELFEMGDTKAKVLSVEGSPDDAGDTVYRYGSSLVYFRDGRVRGWVNRLPRLRVRSWDSLESPSIERFSLGSSRNEVVRAQGAPGAFTTDTYLFGSSAVYFSQGRVSGWSEGGVALKTLDLPQLPFRDPAPARP